jgi:hypothetical protein
MAAYILAFMGAHAVGSFVWGLVAADTSLSIGLGISAALMNKVRRPTEARRTLSRNSRVLARSSRCWEVTGGFRVAMVTCLWMSSATCWNGMCVPI